MTGPRSTVAVVLVSTAAALVAAALLTGWMIVEVETTGPDAVHVTVPVPLGLLQAALAVIPGDSLPREELPAGFPLDPGGLLEIVEALDATPGATSIRVDSPEARVLLVADDGEISVDVDAPEARVGLRVPVAGVRSALERWDGRSVDPRMILSLFAAAGAGPVLRVEAPEATVRIDLR